MKPKDNKPSEKIRVFNTSEVFHIKQDVVKIGRSTENDLILSKAYVSRAHAEIRYKNGQYELVDLGSTCGTYVNGKKISPSRKLSRGDIITVANVSMVFGYDGADDPPLKGGYRPQKTKAGKDGETKELKE
jgi:pSer/pThr/pTyr-binding forkhead associated (FHA) protein